MGMTERLDEIELQTAAKFAAMQVVLMMMASALFKGGADAVQTRRRISEFEEAVVETITPKMFAGLEGKKRHRAAELGRAFASEMIGGLIVPDGH